jgi:site-specific DNA-methyltransferase (adenine-specific)
MDADLLPPESTIDAPRRSMQRLVLPCGVTLYNGDCREILPQIMGDIVVTDPPYGLEYPYRSYDDTRENLATLLDEVMPLILAAAGRAVVMPGPTQIGLYPQPEWVGCVTWNTTGTFGKRGYNQWTPLLCYGPDVAGFGNVNGITKSDVLPISGGSAELSESVRMKAEGIHTCPKPLNMMKKVIQRHTMENEIVIDPFMGSGTTAIACVQMGRRFIGIEQDPEYFKSAVERIRAATAQGDMFLGQNTR